MGIVGKIALGAGALAVAGVAETAYFYRRVMKRQHTDVQRTTKMAGTDWSQHMDIIQARKEYLLAQPSEEAYITSYDGLKLHATYIPAINDKLDKKRVAICFHGYTSQQMKDFLGLTDYYFKRGYCMLHPDARAHGQSEGEYIGFGCLDRKDALMWIDWVIEKCGPDVEILLHGISMGGATVLMASGLELPPQVKGIVSDCAFTSPKEVFTHVLKTMYHLPTFPIMPASEIINQKLAGYGMDECNAKREVAKAKVPMLFIHGTADTFVPSYMCDEIYECCAAPKTKLIIEGAAHAESYFKDMDAYENALDAFATQVF